MTMTTRVLLELGRQVLLQLQVLLVLLLQRLLLLLQLHQALSEAWAKEIMGAW